MPKSIVILTNLTVLCSHMSSINDVLYLGGGIHDFVTTVYKLKYVHEKRDEYAGVSKIKITLFMKRYNSNSNATLLTHEFVPFFLCTMIKTPKGSRQKTPKTIRAMP